jgi:hypothetical protein
MHRNIEFDLAELVAQYVPAGSVVLRVPRRIALRLVDGLEILDADIETERDIDKIPPTEWNGLTVRYQLDEQIKPDHAEIEQEGKPGIVIALPFSLRT